MDGIQLSGMALISGTAALLVAAVAVGVARAGGRAGLKSPLLLSAALVLGVSLWLALTAALALAGFLEVSEGRLPLEPLLPPMALVTFILLGRTTTFRRLLVALPPWQPVALQAFRVGVELGFLRLYLEGHAPLQITFEGRNFDALVGLTALPVAGLIALRLIGPRLTIAWNLFGLAALGNAVFTAATSAPGPQHLDWPGEPFTALAEWPVVWVPALLAPAGIFFHLLSIRQAVARLRTDRHVPTTDERRGAKVGHSLASGGAARE